jgi:hypothetical protein
MNSPIFVHCHIFKNAGTSLIEAFKKCFLANAVELEPVDPDDYITSSDIEKCIATNPDVAFISSHRVTLPLPKTIKGRKIIPIVFIRDPMDRFGSVYRFERNETRSTVYSALAKSASMRGFFEAISCIGHYHSGFNTIIHDVQFQFCGGVNQRDINSTVNYLLKDALIGLVEDYNFSLFLIEATVKKYYPDSDLPVFEENTTKSNSDIFAGCKKTLLALGKKLAKDLHDNNKNDYKIYEAINKRLLAEWSSPEVQERYKDFCGKNSLKVNANRITGAPSLKCFKGLAFNSHHEEDHRSRWSLVNKVSDHGLVALRSVKIELNADLSGPVVEAGRSLRMDVRVEWKDGVYSPFVSLIIRDHCGKIAGHQDYFVDTLSLFGNIGLYQLHFEVPEILPGGLYMLDVEIGYGLPNRKKILVSKKAVSAFGVIPVSANAEKIPSEYLEARVQTPSFLH